MMARKCSFLRKGQGSARFIGHRVAGGEEREGSGDGPAKGRPPRIISTRVTEKAVRKRSVVPCTTYVIIVFNRFTY